MEPLRDSPPAARIEPLRDSPSTPKADPLKDTQSIASITSVTEAEMNDYLVHAAECCQDHEHCTSQLCGLLKSKIAHHRDCPVDQYCPECLEVIDLCMRHALECGKGHDECKYVGLAAGIAAADAQVRGATSVLWDLAHERKRKAIQWMATLVNALRIAG